MWTLAGSLLTDMFTTDFRTSGRPVTRRLNQLTSFDAA